jgi:hypothetical protein
MIRTRFINIIGNNSDAIARRWAKVVGSSEFTETYGKLSQDELTSMAKTVYENLGWWLGPETSQSEIGRVYTGIGAKRYLQEYPLCEIHYAIHFTKAVLLNYIFSEGLLPDTLTLYRANAFLLEISDFFDLAIFYTTRGFQEALYKKLLSEKSLTKERLKDIFPVNSFYFEAEQDFKSFERAMGGFNLFKVK